MLALTDQILKAMYLHIASKILKLKHLLHKSQKSWKISIRAKEAIRKANCGSPFFNACNFQAREWYQIFNHIVRLIIVFDTLIDIIF